MHDATSSIWTSDNVTYAREPNFPDHRDIKKTSRMSPIWWNVKRSAKERNSLHSQIRFPTQFSGQRTVLECRLTCTRYNTSLRFLLSFTKKEIGALQEIFQEIRGRLPREGSRFASLRSISKARSERSCKAFPSYYTIDLFYAHVTPSC